MGVVAHDVLEILRRFPTSDISDTLDGLGLRNQAVLGLRPLWEACPRIAGRAMTVELAPAAENTKSVTIGTVEAIKAANPGDILVFDNGGRTDINSVGSLVAFCSIRAGLAGCIVDGAARDIEDIRLQAFPTFTRAVVPTSIRHRTGLVGFGEPIQCAGVIVRRGDFVVADASGVVIIPAERAEEVATLAPRYQRLELAIRARLIQGMDWKEAHDVYDDFTG